MKKIKTDDLLKQLKAVEDTKALELFFEKNNENLTNKSFSEYFNGLILEKNLEKNLIIKASNIHRTYGYQILQGKRNPGRNKALALCISGAFTLEETQRALSLAQESRLYSKIKRDAIIIFSINKGLSLSDLNELLHSQNEWIIE